jgi:hypothetical protein
MNTLSKWTMALALLSGTAYGQTCTNLIYIGAPQTYLVKGLGPYTFYNAPVVGTVTLSTFLPANVVNSAITPLAWDFSTEQAGLSSGAPNTSATAFTFSTDSAGNITAWSFSVGYNDGIDRVLASGLNPGFMPGSGSGDFSGGPYYDGVSKTDFPTTSVYNTVSTAAGAWYCLAPIVDPLAAVVASLRTQLAGITAERDVYENLFRVADQEIATLERK